MKESYRDFLKRISYQNRALMIGEGAFVPDRTRVFPKVDERGRYRPFYGDTVVFGLGRQTRGMLAQMQDKLYEGFGGCFAERLPENTLHMTLHDLSASDDLGMAAPECFMNEIGLLGLTDRDTELPDEIRMKTNYIINMVNTGLVMTLLPENEGEWDKLERLYRLIDRVKVCPYPYLTPHITLAYFNRGGFDEHTANALKEAVWELNGLEKKTVVLRTDSLYYQKFMSMKEYVSVFCLHR